MSRQLTSLDTAEPHDVPRTAPFESSSSVTSGRSQVVAIAMESQGGVVTFQETGTGTSSGLTFNEAVTTLIINCIGAGNILFPYILADAGMIVGPTLLIICAFTLHLAGGMVCNACNIAEELENRNIHTFEALANMCSPFFGVALVITKNFAMLGRIVTYMQLVVDSVALFFPGNEPLCKPVVLIRFVIVFPVFSYLAMITNLKQLARVATLGVVGAITLCGCIVVGGLAILVKRFPDLPTYTWLPATSAGADDFFQQPILMFGRMGKYFAVFLFTFAIIATVPSVRAQLAEPRQMKGVLSRTYTIIVIINLIVMFCGYLGFGVQAPENIISGEGGVAEEMPSIGIIAVIALVVKVVVGTPLFCFVVINAFEASGGGALRTPMTNSNISMRIMLILSLNVIGMSLPYLMEGISLASSVFACFNNMIFPALFCYILRKRLPPGAHSERYLAAKYVVVAITGLCLFVFGFKGSLESVKEKIRANANAPQVRC